MVAVSRALSFTLFFCCPVVILTTGISHDRRQSSFSLFIAMNTRSQSRHIIVDQQQLSPLPEKVVSSASAVIKTGVNAAVAVPNALCATVNLLIPDKSHVQDAETSGRVVVKEWDAIGQQGVFAGSTLIAAGEVLGTLEGVVIRRRRLSRAERRRFVGIRVNNRAAHIDVQGRWPEKVNHGPPCRTNAEWNPETRLITAVRDILPDEQVLFDYGVGYWVDDLINRDYDKLPKDQRTFFDTMHALVDNYAWLSCITRRRGLSQVMRVGIIAFFLSQQYLGSCRINKLSTLDDATCGVVVGVQHMNPLEQYLSNWGLAVQPSGAVNVLSDELANEASKVGNIERTSPEQSIYASSSITISATDAHASDSLGCSSPLGDGSHGQSREVTEYG